MRLEDAKLLAESLAGSMAPFCERVEVAGSIRRRKPLVKDIEIVAIPKWGSAADSANLFGARRPLNLLHEWATRIQTTVKWIKPATKEVISWSIKPDGKYWRGLLIESQLKLDLFLCRPENWGVIYAIRTGAAEFSQALVTHAKRNTHFRVIEGSLVEGHRPLGGPVVSGAVTPCPEESDLFELLGLEYVAPEDRIDARAVRVRKAAA